jgi:hypothetical protein
MASMKLEKTMHLPCIPARQLAEAAATAAAADPVE